MVLKVVIMKTRGNLGPKRSLYTMVREEKEQEHMSRFGCRNTIAALLVFC